MLSNKGKKRRLGEQKQTGKMETQTVCMYWGTLIGSQPAKRQHRVPGKMPSCYGPPSYLEIGCGAHETSCPMPVSVL